MEGPYADAFRALLTIGGVQSLVILLLTVGLVGWGHAIAARRIRRAWWMAAWLPLLAMLLLGVGVGATLVATEPALHAIEGRDPPRVSGRAANATWTARVSFGSALTLYVASILVFVRGSRWPPTDDSRPRSPPSRP
jgi:hypothetical protein